MKYDNKLISFADCYKKESKMSMNCVLTATNCKLPISKHISPVLAQEDCSIFVQSGYDLTRRRWSHSKGVFSIKTRGFKLNNAVTACDKNAGQALIAVIMLLLIMFIMAFGLMTSTLSLNNTNQNDVYLHGAQSASQTGLTFFSELLASDGKAFYSCGTGCKTGGTFYQPVPGQSYYEYYSVQLSFPGCYDSHSVQPGPCNSIVTCEQASPIGQCTFVVTSVGCIVASSSSTACLDSVTSTSSETYHITSGSFLQYALYDNYSSDDPADASQFGTRNASGVYTETQAQYNAAEANCSFYMWSQTSYLLGTKQNPVYSPNPNQPTSYNTPSYNYGPNAFSYKGPNGHTRYCVNTYEDFGSQYNGPVYTSDIFWDCGAVFNGPVYTGDPISPTSSMSGQNLSQYFSGGAMGPYSPYGGVDPNYTIGSPYWTEYPGCNSQPTFNNLNGSPTNCNPNSVSNPCIQQVPLITPPSSLSALETSAISGGCLYTGPTVIQLQKDGVMDVYSPDTISYPVNSNHSFPFYATPTNGSYPCGTPGTSCLGGGSASHPTCQVNVPDVGVYNSINTEADGAVYVQNVPASEQATMNSTGLSNYFCPYVEGEILAPNEQSTCQFIGDLLIQGGNGYSGSGSYFDAAATFGSDSNIVITGSLTYAESAYPGYGGGPIPGTTNQYAYYDTSDPSLSDSVGLAATYFSLINLPANSGYFGYGVGTGGAAHANYTIDGAVFAANNSFGIDNLANGCTKYNVLNCPRGDNGPAEGSITVNGTIVSNFTLNNCDILNGSNYSGYCGYNTNYDQSFSNTVNRPPNFPIPQVVPTQYIGS